MRDWEHIHFFKKKKATTLNAAPDYSLLSSADKSNILTTGVFFFFFIRKVFILESLAILLFANLKATGSGYYENYLNI